MLPCQHLRRYHQRSLQIRLAAVITSRKDRHDRLTGIRHPPVSAVPSPHFAAVLPRRLSPRHASAPRSENTAAALDQLSRGSGTSRISNWFCSFCRAFFNPRSCNKKEKKFIKHQTFPAPSAQLLLPISENGSARSKNCILPAAYLFPDRLRHCIRQKSLMYPQAPG